MIPTAPTLRRMVTAGLVIVLGLGMLNGVPASAAAPPGFQTTTVIDSGLDGPSGFEIAPDGRIFILERSGTIRIYKDGQLLPQPFAVLPSEASGDRGLIGVAFHPDFGVSNSYVYFYYTGTDLRNRLVRFDASTDVGANGPLTIFQTQSLSQQLHVGGSIEFGPDGKLYFAVGDNGYGSNAQDLSNPHGKILRVNADGTVPTDNPFYGQAGKVGAIWAFGFRNPWRFQFDGATGRLYGGDVGDFTWEEVNLIVKGGNYGWPLKEGFCTSDCVGYLDPLHAYPHDCESAAVTMGPVYRGSMFPAEYAGDLFFGDYAKGFIRHADLDAEGRIAAVHPFNEEAGSVVDLKVAPDGSLYYLTFYPGALYRVAYDPDSNAPVASASADVTGGAGPLEVHFSSAGTHDPDGDELSYLWSFGDGTTSTQPNPTKTYTEIGVYTARLTVSDGASQSTATPIVIQVGIPPTVTIAIPQDEASYRAGDTITYNAFASDAAGFDVSDANISTEVRLHHGTHVHPFLGPFTGRAGTFTIPTTGEASADTWYEIRVTATDTNGLVTTKAIQIRPLKSILTLTTNPAGLGLQLDGVPIETPHVVEGVEGFQRELSAPPIAVDGNGIAHNFVGWSDGKAIRHTITTPEDDTTYTATYEPATPFVGQYFANKNLSGPPVVVREDPLIDFAWGEGSPDPSVPADQFSVRWKTQFFSAGRYRFTTVSDDGIRLFIDNKLVIDEWHGQSGTAHDVTLDLGRGNHSVKLEFYDDWGLALASLRWVSTNDQPSDTYRAEYWNTPGTGGRPSVPSSPPTLVRTEDSLHHNWGADSPADVITPDHFVARWTKTANFVPGRWQFSVRADDGVRVLVDGVPIINAWIDQPPTSYVKSVLLTGGQHDITVEYYENAGGAELDFDYEQIADAEESPAYEASYWNTPNATDSWSLPTAAPDLVRTDESINFDWGGGSPAPEISADKFMARWTKTDVLPSGVYRFSGRSDDGIRVFIDDVPVVNAWRDQNAAFSADRYLEEGPHAIRVEYYENRVGAAVQVDYERVGATPAQPAYRAEYFSNGTLSGTPAATRDEESVDFDWGSGSPDPAIGNDGFSARWTTSVTVDPGNYAFTTTADDGVRVFVDGALVINEWKDQSPTTHSAVRHLDAGEHTIVIEYFENGGGALARFDWSATDEEPAAGNPYRAEYFANRYLEGAPVLTRADDEIDFTWGGDSPGVGVPTDGFSARWTRKDVYEAGSYQLTATGDDGIRVLVDSVVVIDGWVDQGPTTYVANVELTAGEHTIVVEYYENGGDATARFSQRLR